MSSRGKGDRRFEGLAFLIARQIPRVKNGEKVELERDMNMRCAAGRAFLMLCSRCAVYSILAEITLNYTPMKINSINPLSDYTSAGQRGINLANPPDPSIGINILTFVGFVQITLCS